MNRCAEQALENPVRADCPSRFQDTALIATVEKIRLALGDIDIDLIVEGKKHLTCGLDGSEYKGQVANLNKKDRVKVRGTLSRRMSSAYSVTMVLRPCELLDVVPAATAK